MNRKIVLCRGIPCSGKSTWAKSEVENNWAIRFNKDEIRKEDWLFPAWYFYSKENEEIVIEAERDMVLIAMVAQNPYIIVDNTHLGHNNKHITFYRELAERNRYNFEVKDFYVSREEAIERDKLRDKEEQVWEDVINKMIKMSWNNWYPLNPTFRVQNSNLKDCIIVDIDWTLAFMDNKRSPYEFDKVMWDKCNIFLLNLLESLKDKYDIFILSWREETCRKETEEWLDINWVAYNSLFMRKEWDKRCDTIVKWEIYENYIAKHYNVFAVFDDRQKVIQMWRLKYHLPTYEVFYWYF